MIVVEVLMIMIIISAILVGTGKTSINSVFSLILNCLFTSLLFLVLGAEFMAFMVLIIYIGAVVVFFLFVIMMVPFGYQGIDSKQHSRINFFFKMVFIYLFYFIVMMFMPYSGRLVPIVVDKNIIFGRSSLTTLSFGYKGQNVSDIKIIGHSLYGDFAPVFIFCGLVLLVSMIGCVALTVKAGLLNRKRQNRIDQTLKSIDSI